MLGYEGEMWVYTKW